jgi:hypothetical protein
MPLMMRHLLEVADADEVHLMVKYKDTAGDDWLRTRVALWYYTELGFRDPRGRDPSFSYLPTINEKFDPGQQKYLVVTSAVLKTRSLLPNTQCAKDNLETARSLMSCCLRP